MPITDEALDHYNDVALHGETPITTWYIGLIDSSGYSTLAAGDTLASHAGWTECTAYDEGARQEWTEGASSGGETTNAAGVEFTMSDTKTVKGAFICSAASGTSGVLLGCWLFDEGDKSVVDGDVLRVFSTAILDQAA